MMKEMEDNIFVPELHPPPFERICEKEFILPLAIYFIFFRLASYLMKKHYWKSFSGFKQYRLHNLSICFLHSTISGLWSLSFLLLNKKIMLNGIVTWYNYTAAQLPLVSIAYFLHDAIDMLNHEWSRWTLELLFHHITTCLALTTGLVPHRFLICNYWALLMEVNSIFLHTRTIMQISGYSTSHPAYYEHVIKGNIITFILFRFLAQAIFVVLILKQWNNVHQFYLFVALGGPIVFLVINGMLFFRVLVSDGFLGEEWKKRAAISRDDTRKAELISKQN